MHVEKKSDIRPESRTHYPRSSDDIVIWDLGSHYLGKSSNRLGFRSKTGVSQGGGTPYIH